MKNSKLRLYDMISIAIFVGILVVFNYLDNFFTLVRPFHLILTALIISIVGFWRGTIILTLFAIIFYLTGGFNFIVSWEQFILLWISGYTMLVFGFFNIFCIKKNNKINWYKWFLMWIIVEIIFFYIVVIANTYFFMSELNFWKRFYLSMILPSNWLENLVSAIPVFFLIPLLYKPLLQEYKKIITINTKKY